MIAKLTSLVLLAAGCSSSAPAKPQVERGPATATPAPAPASREQAEEEANQRDPVVVALETEHADIMIRSEKALEAAPTASTSETRVPLIATLDTLVKARADLAKRTEATRLGGEHRHAYLRFERIEVDLTRLEPTLLEAYTDLLTKQNDSDRAAAFAKLKQLQKERAEMEAPIKADKAKKR